jgi:hypothetical protein
MNELEIRNQKYLKYFNKVYAWFAGFTSDLLFYVAISTLFYTIVKGFSMEQIVFLTTITSFTSILLRLPLLKLMQKIGNVLSVRIGLAFLLLASILITFGESYFIIIIAECLYAIAFIFLGMLAVILKHNLTYQKLDDEYIRISNKASTIYAVITAIIAFTAGFLFNINNYLPMYLCIFFCFINFIISFTIKEVEYVKTKENITKLSFKFNKMVWGLLLSYGLFSGLLAMGQGNGELLMQYELLDFFSAEKTAIYLTLIVAFSRIARVGANIVFTKIYYKYRDKVSLYLGLMLMFAFLFLSVGYFVNFNLVLKFGLMAIGFFLVLMSRDPFRTYTQDTLLKKTEADKHQLVIAYLGFAKQLSIAILSLSVSILLIKIEMIYVIILLIFVSALEFLIIFKIYKLLNKK